MSAHGRAPKPYIMTEQEAQAALDSFAPEHRLFDVTAAPPGGADALEGDDEFPAEPPLPTRAVASQPAVHGRPRAKERATLPLAATAAVLAVCAVGLTAYRVLVPGREVNAAFSPRALNLTPIGLVENVPLAIEPTTSADSRHALVDTNVTIPDPAWVRGASSWRNEAPPPRAQADARSAGQQRSPFNGNSAAVVAGAAEATVPEPIGTTSFSPIDSLVESRTALVDPAPPIVAEYRPASPARPDPPEVRVPSARASLVPPAVSLPAAAAASVPTDRTAIQSTLGQYRAAFAERSTGAVEAVWPTVDLKLLERAFNQVSEQEFTFESCQISIAGASASAACSGQARYVPTVGNRSDRVERRRWDFQLKKSNGAWLIDRVSSR